MARASRTPFVVLGILGILDQKPISGYDIKQVIGGTISHFWSESYGQIYPVLKTLAVDKLIIAKAIKTSGRKKIVYTITPKGRKALAAWMEKTPEQGPMRDELVLKLFFGSQTSPDVLIGHLQGYRNRLSAVVTQYESCLNQAQGQTESYTPFQMITLRGGITMVKAFLQWADESLATLRQMKGAK